MNEEDVRILHALMRDLKESINNLQIRVDKTESRLKNLGDIELNFDEPWTIMAKVKALAIKRAKWWKKRMGEDFKIPRDYNYWKGRFDEIMEVNNLKKEDLK